MRKLWIVAASLICVLALGAALVGVALLRRPDYAPRGTPRGLAQDTRRLQMELPLAASRKPYLVLDLVSSRLHYRISGMTPKTIPFKIDSIRGRFGYRPLAPQAMTLLVLKGRGAPREVIRPPDPDKPEDPLKDPSIFPPDPPTDYTLTFDRPVKIRILGEKKEGWRVRLAFMERTIRRWLGRGRGKAETRILLRLPASRAQEIYRGLYRGEKILVLGAQETPREAGSPVTEG